MRRSNKETKEVMEVINKLYDLTRHFYMYYNDTRKYGCRKIFKSGRIDWHFVKSEIEKRGISGWEIWNGGYGMCKHIRDK